jgi:hypothetical protein
MDSLVAAIRETRPLAILAVGILIASVLLTLWLPIYPDEVASKILLERYFINGGFKQSLTPYCVAGFLFRPPASLLPAAVSWTALNVFGTGLTSYRLLPIACLTMLGLGAQAHARDADGAAWPILLVVTLGPVLYGLSILRPEVFLLAAAFVIYAAGSKLLEKPGLRHSALLMLLIVFVFSLVLFMHPKAVYLAPLAFACLIIGSAGLSRCWQRAAFLLTCGGVLAWITGDAINMQRAQYLSCNNFPLVEQIMSRQAVNPLDIFHDVRRFASSSAEALSPSLWSRAISQITFKGDYDIRFLPGAKPSFVTHFENALVIVVCFCFAIYSPFKVCFGCISSKTKALRRQYILLAVLIAVLYIQFLLNLTKNWYDVSLFVGSIALTAALAWPLPLGIPWPKRILPIERYASTIVESILVFTAAISLCMNETYFTARFVRGYQGPYIVDFKIQRLLAKQIPDILRRNGITSNQPIIVDDLTYDLVKSQPITVPITYLLANNDVGSAISNSLEIYKVHYGIVLCSYMPGFESYVKASVLETVNLPNDTSVCVFRVMSRVQAEGQL